jgi:DNA-binding LytR/AlgR family response regulator
MRIIIFEDEIPAYKKLLSYVEAELPNSKVLGWAQSITEGIQLLEKFDQVDLILSDIELLDGISFNIFEQKKVKTPVIFCTAFDEYLFKAFQTNGIAYLLKPYTQQNFKHALDKYKMLFSNSKKDKIDEDVLKQLKSLVKDENRSFKQRFSVKKKNGIKLLNSNEIINFEASGDFSFAYDNEGSKHVVNYSLGEIESKVNPNKFFRINRSEMINIDFIDHIESHFKNRLLIKMKKRKEDLFTSSSKTPFFRQWLEK